MPRRLALVAVLALAAPASAQAAFLQSCTMSAAARPPDGMRPAELCACAAEVAQGPAYGIEASTLDRIGDYTMSVPFETLPEPIQEAVVATTESIAACAARGRAGARGPRVPAASAGGEDAPPATSGEIRAVQAGRGAIIRIVG